MNETRGNSRTKPMRGGLKGGEINSLKDSEKTNEYIQCTYITTKRTWSQYTLIHDHGTTLKNWFKEHKNLEIINIQTLIIDTYDLCTEIIYRINNK